MTSCSPNTDDLFAEAFACFEQGLCYDEINDYVRFQIRSLSYKTNFFATKIFLKQPIFIFSYKNDGNRTIEPSLRAADRQLQSGGSFAIFGCPSDSNLTDCLWLSDFEENAIIIYERGLNLVKEAELGKNAKKSALYKEICTSRKRVEKRLKKLKKEKTPTQLKRSLTEPEKEKPDEWVMVDKASIGDEDVKHELREQLESINEGEAELVFFIPDGVQLFIIEVIMK
ncbi:unnamed protein product [Anisakis simplex]|uniref:Spartin (inferred by orthology to a human protein) n=1 Tax=Anisakis simplex TaxID=6269 RepID=A0A0M3J891_ANISI|nr:unnamed protein product [Anisakis simplex]